MMRAADYLNAGTSEVESSGQIYETIFPGRAQIERNFKKKKEKSTSCFHERIDPAKADGIYICIFLIFFSLSTGKCAPWEDKRPSLFLAIMY